MRTLHENEFTVADMQELETLISFKCVEMTSRGKKIGERETFRFNQLKEIMRLLETSKKVYLLVLEENDGGFVYCGIA